MAIFASLRASSLPTTVLWTLGGLLLPSVALGCLLSIPAMERRAIYMYDLKTTPKEDLDQPDKFGFPKEQVKPFHIKARDGIVLHAWHVLPLGVYEEHREHLANRSEKHMGNDEPFSVRLLRDDPEARLVIHTHGSSGTLASSWRVNCYKTLSSVNIGKIHVVTFDYRGFGLSEGAPSEQGVITDAEAVFTWAVDVAGVPPERIVIMGHSMGAGVAIALYQRLLVKDIRVAGLVAVAGFVDVATIAKTYKLAGLPLFKPLQIIPGLVDYLANKLESTWKNGDRLVDIVRQSTRYHIEIIHARDDTISPYQNAVELFRRAKTAISDAAATEEQTEPSEPGSLAKVGTFEGSITLTIPEGGDHDKVISRPAVVSAVLRAFALGS